MSSIIWQFLRILATIATQTANISSHLMIAIDVLKCPNLGAVELESIRGSSRIAATLFSTGGQRENFLGDQRAPAVHNGVQ
jgi:hypothetical protein